MKEQYPPTKQFTPQQAKTIVDQLYIQSEKSK